MDDGAQEQCGQIEAARRTAPTGSDRIARRTAAADRNVSYRTERDDDCSVLYLIHAVLLDLGFLEYDVFADTRIELPKRQFSVTKQCEYDVKR